MHQWEQGAGGHMRGGERGLCGSRGGGGCLRLHLLHLHGHHINDGISRGDRGQLWHSTRLGRELEITANGLLGEPGIYQMKELVGRGHLVLLLAYSSLSTKNEEGLSANEVTSDRAVRVLKSNNEG